MARITFRFYFPIIILILANSSAVPAASQTDQVAFYYGTNPPLKALQGYSVVVVEPAYINNPLKTIQATRKMKQELFAYVSLGEVHRSRPYFGDIPLKIMRIENKTWGSHAVDQSSLAWRSFFLATIIQPLYNQGWRGFFLDTLDSYQLFAKTDADKQAQKAGLIATVQEMKQRFPEAKLIFNRGFELLPDLAGSVYGIAAESLYRRYDAASKQYMPVPEADREWLRAQMKDARDRYKLPIISIDYVDPADPQACRMVRDTIARIRADGFIPWVTDGAIASAMQVRCQL